MEVDTENNIGTEISIVHVFFVRRFQTKKVKEAQTSTSQLELEASIAKGIPYHVGFHV